MLERKRPGTLRYIPEEDTAIDRSASDYNAYAKDGVCNWAHIKLIEGQTPTVFEVGRMTTRQRMRWNDLVQDRGAEASATKEYVVRCVLRKAEGLVAEDGVTPMRDIDFETESDGRLVSRRWLDDAGLPLKLLSEIAILGIALSEARVPLS